MNDRFLILVLFLVTLVSCFKKPDGSKDGLSILNYPLESEIETLDPAVSYDQTSGSVVSQLYESLYEYEYLMRPYTLRPLLAEGMPIVSSDKKTYTIKLKKNIYYYSKHLDEETEVQAEDFINQLKRLAFKPTNSPGFYFVDGVIAGINNWRDKVGSDLNLMLSTPVEGLKALDRHTLQIKLAKPRPNFLFTLAMSFTAPIPKKSILKFENNFHDKVIGTGPYYLDTWSQRFKIHLKRNPKYNHSFYPEMGDRPSRLSNLLKDKSKKLPFIDEVKFEIIKEDTTRWFNFQKNNFDFIIVPKDQFRNVMEAGELKKEFIDRNISLQTVPTLTYWWMAYNMKDPLLGQNKDLRLAIAHAIDIKEYIKLFTGNTWQRSNSLLPPGVFGYNLNQELPYKFNLEKAKNYLAKAGYPEGKGLPILKYETRNSSSTDSQRADFFRNQLSRIGIKLSIIKNSFPSFLKKAKQGEMQLWMGGWALDYPDSTNGLKLLTTMHMAPGSNSSQYSNQRFDELFKKSQVMSNDKEKLELIKKMEAIFFEDHPWTLLFYRRRSVLSHENLENFRFDELISNNVKYWRLKPKS